MEEGGDLEGWNGKQGCFSTRQILVGHTNRARAEGDAMQAAGNSASTDAVRDDCEVFSYSGVPGASFQTLHTAASWSWFTGNSRKQPAIGEGTGECTTHGNWERKKK